MDLGQGYSDDQAGYMGLVTVACGLLGAGLAGAYLDHTHKFLETMKACFVCATISLVGFMLACWPGRFEYLMAACGALGFCAFAALPTGMELCVETTYPVNEGLSTCVFVCICISVYICVYMCLCVVMVLCSCVVVYLFMRLF